MELFLRQAVQFARVNAADISDRLSIRIAGINGMDAGTAAQSGILQTRAIPGEEWADNVRYVFNKGNITDYIVSYSERDTLEQRKREWERVIPAHIWDDPVTSILMPSYPSFMFGRNSALFNGWRNITIPDSVTFIGPWAMFFILEEGEIYLYNSSRGDLRHENSITIGANVTLIFDGYSRDSPWHKFVDYYNKNGKKAGIYHCSVARGINYEPPPR